MRLIDADAAIEAIESKTYRHTYLDQIVEIIKDLPTIQPKKGKWIVYKAPDAYHCGLCKCPFCGEEMIAEADEYNFCPNCGADMRGEENER